MKKKKKKKMFKESMPPSKPMGFPGKMVEQRKYSQDDERYNDKQDSMDNFGMKPKSAAGALNKAKEGYSKRPRPKPSKKKKR